MYELLVEEIHQKGVNVIEMKFKGSFKGLYADDTIAISSTIDTDAEKTCILAEEIGHHYTTFGNILSTKDIENVKQEKRARNWGYEKLVGIVDIINAFNANARDHCELSEYLNVTEEFLDLTIKHYREKYGVSFEIDNYIVYFEPNFGILKRF